MTTSQTTFLTEIVSGEKIPVGKLEYFRSRLASRLHELIIDEFVKQSELGRLSKADLARRLSKEPAQITRWLGAPSNWTLDTLSDLALGMGCEPSLKLVRLAQHSAISNYSQEAPSSLVDAKVQSPDFRQVTQIQSNQQATSAADDSYQTRGHQMVPSGLLNPSPGKSYAIQNNMGVTQ